MVQKHVGLLLFPDFNGTRFPRLLAWKSAVSFALRHPRVVLRMVRSVRTSEATERYYVVVKDGERIVWSWRCAA